MPEKSLEESRYVSSFTQLYEPFPPIGVRFCSSVLPVKREFFLPLLLARAVVRLWLSLKYLETIQLVENTFINKAECGWEHFPLFFSALYVRGGGVTGVPVGSLDKKHPTQKKIVIQVCGIFVNKGETFLRCKRQRQRGTVVRLGKTVGLIYLCVFFQVLQFPPTLQKHKLLLSCRF